MITKFKLLVIGILLSTSVYTQSTNSFYILEDIETNDDSVGNIYLNHNADFTFNYMYVTSKKNLQIKKVRFARYFAGNEILINNLKLIYSSHKDVIKQIYTSKADDGPIVVTVILDTLTNTFDIEIYNIRYEQYVKLYYKLL